MKKHLIIGFSLLAVFIVFTVLVSFVDVKAIGRQGSDVGFAMANETFRNFIGYHEGLYDFTEILGYLCFVPIAVFGLLGLWQMIQRKSLLKVDKDILLLGCFYAVLLAAYVLFEKLVINYRPEFAGETVLEPSYPSSHTLLFGGVMATTVMQLLKRIRNSAVKWIAVCAVVLSAILVVFGRLFSGVHWLTDILGGMLLGTSLVWMYFAVAFVGKKENVTEK
ncbi:MAG: phosphatase PAP2 family protein [Lachnospiraceae bacterium]|nr:phosphatase PAP2 family protein [Lachnospiraceae bacterium]